MVWGLAALLAGHPGHKLQVESSCSMPTTALEEDCAAGLRGSDPASPQSHLPREGPTVMPDREALDAIAAGPDENGLSAAVTLA